MKIAFDHEIFCRQPFGGISRYFTQLAEQFALRNHDVKIFAPFHINRYIPELPNGVVQGTHLDHYPKKTDRFFKAYNDFFVRRKIKRWDHDITHETYYANTRTGPANKPTVLTVYDMIHELNFASSPITKELKRKSVERADHIIAISENTRTDLMKTLGVSSDKISVIHLGFDIRKTASNFKPDHEIPYLLYVGPRLGYKNFLRFIEAVASSPSLKGDFNIVAFGGYDFTPEEQDMIRKLGFRADQVLQVSGNDSLLSEYYDGAHAFVYPSLYEGFGIPPLEAMAHKCPVISSNTSSMPEIIGDAAEFFNPLNTPDITRAISSVVYSDQRREQLIKKGLSRLQMYSWEACAEQTLNVYQKVIT